MARRYWMLPVPGFSDCSRAECDVDKGRPTAIRNKLEHANVLLEGYFRALYVPFVVQKLGWNPLQPRTPPPNQ